MTQTGPTPDSAAALERLTDEQEDIHIRLLDALEQTGWIEPEWRDGIDPLGAAVFVADAFIQSTDAKQAVLQSMNSDNARRRELLLAALGMEDDGRTGLDEYIRRLIEQRDEARAERDRLLAVANAARRLRDAARDTTWVPDAVDGAIGDVVAAVDALDADAPECPGDPYCRPGHRCPAHRDADGVVDRVLLDATDAPVLPEHGGREDLIARACGDPGSVVARRDRESLSRWAARAVIAVLNGLDSAAPVEPAIQDRIERSSLGTPDAREMRARTPDAVAQAIVGRAAALADDDSGGGEQEEIDFVGFSAILCTRCTPHILTGAAGLERHNAELHPDGSEPR